MKQSVAILQRPTRKRAALRLLQAREAANLSQEQVADALGISKRQYGTIERGQVRAIGLEAFVFLEGQRHAAFGVKAPTQSDLRSHQTNLSESVAPGGQITTTNFAEWSPCTQDVGALAMKRSDTRGEHTARACGAMAGEPCSRSAPTVCLSSVDAQASHLSVCAHEGVGRGARPGLPRLLAELTACCASSSGARAEYPSDDVAIQSAPIKRRAA